MMDLSPQTLYFIAAGVAAIGLLQAYNMNRVAAGKAKIGPDSSKTLSIGLMIAMAAALILFVWKILKKGGMLGKMF